MQEVEVVVVLLVQDFLQQCGRVLIAVMLQMVVNIFSWMKQEVKAESIEQEH